MKKNKKYGFTLVELLAVIVILAVILVIAVPKVMNIINDTKKSTFAASVKLIVSGAEQRYAENKVLGKDEEINCENIAKLSSSDYKLCEIAFENEQARVTVIGSGKFDGLSVVYATKTNAEVQTGEPDRLYTFDEVYEIVDNLTARIEELENNNSGSSDIIENLQKQIDENKNKINENENKLSNNSTSISNLINKDNSNNIFLQTYPVGSIYISENNANPGTKFGGTWVAYGAGRALVGVDSSQAEFASVGKTGGEKSTLIKTENLPDSVMVFGNIEVGNWSTGVWSSYNTEKYWASIPLSEYRNMYTMDTPHNNLQPYITVYMWKRTA